MDEDYKMIESALSRQITRDGVTIDVKIYRGEDDGGWILEVVDEFGGSTVWQEPFATEAEALNEVLMTIKLEGIESFVKDENASLH
jgi:uncharacterized protein